MCGHAPPPLHCSGRLPYSAGIVDPLWNGVDESVKMASLCDVYEVNCAAHNYHGWLGTAICAHFCAAIPNFKVLEVDVDDLVDIGNLESYIEQTASVLIFLSRGYFFSRNCESPAPS